MPGVRRLLKTLRELGFPAADARPGLANGPAAGPASGSANGLANGHGPLAADAPYAPYAHETPALTGVPDAPALSFAAAALLREYEAWLGDWDDACARAALGGTPALDTIYAFARLRTTFPFAPDILDDATVAALCARPWDAHHRALLGLDPEASPARIPEESERRIGQACAILGDAALAIPAEGDYHAKLHWLRRIATAHGKAATEALLAALLAPPGEPLLSVATTQNRHGAAAVLGRLCERARLTVAGPVGGALAALDARYQHVMDARPILVHRHAGEQPQVDWVLPLAPELSGEAAHVGDAPDGDAAPEVEEPLGAPHGRRLRALSETARALQEWYTSAAAALRAVAAERSSHAPPHPPAALEALAGRRMGNVLGEAGGRRMGDALGDTGARRVAETFGDSTTRRAREEPSPQRAALTMEQARARAQLMREQLRDAAAQIERADAASWVQVVATARQLERWLAPVARGWAETDPSVTPLLREVRELASQLAAQTSPPVRRAELPDAPEEPAVPAAAESLAESAPEARAAEHETSASIAAAHDPADAPVWMGAQPEAYELPDVPVMSVVPVAPEPPVEEVPPARPKRRRTRKTEPQAEAQTEAQAASQAEAQVNAPPESAPPPKRRSRKRKAAPADPIAPAPATSVETETAPEPEPEPVPTPEPPPPPVDWTPQLKTIEMLGAQWAQGTVKRSHSRSGAAADPERERLIGQLNQLVWPIVSGGIDPYSDAARTIRRTLEPIVNEANRFADRQHGRAMHAFRHGATQANSFGARRALREALQEVEAGLEFPVPDCPGPFRDVREEYDATRNRLLLLRNYIAVKL